MSARLGFLVAAFTCAAAANAFSQTPRPSPRRSPVLRPPAARPSTPATPASSLALLTEARSLERLRRLFAPTPVPSAIEALFRYQLRHGEGYAQDFAIDTEASVSPWTGSDAVATRSLAPFATQWDGSVFAIWRSAGARTLDEAPVVLLDSEGRSSRVLARSVHEFMGLVALASILPDVTPGTLEDAPDVEAFRRWLRAELSIAVPSQPAAVIANARRANPGLQRWLDVHPPLLRVPARPRRPTPAITARPLN